MSHAGEMEFRPKDEPSREDLMRRAAPITDDRRNAMRVRAVLRVARILKECASAWGGGWHMLSVDKRRHELVQRVMMDMALLDDDVKVPAETMTYLLEMARESLRVAL